MTVYMLFAFAGTAIYAGVAHVEDVVVAIRDADLNEPALFDALSVCFAAIILFYAARIPDELRADIRRASGRKTYWPASVAAILTGGIALVAALAGESGAGRLRAEAKSAAERTEGVVSDAQMGSVDGRSANTTAATGTSEAAAGSVLFQQRGCVLCHRADGTGVGPALQGLFGSPAPPDWCGPATVDEEYVREAILTPAATVAAGFTPVMPPFAGLLTEEELQALVVYVKSLSVASRSENP